MRIYFADTALLPRGWVRNVRIEVNSRGDIAAVHANASPEGAEKLAGPVLPGMANLHSHAFQRAMAGLTEIRGAGKGDFWTWRETMYRFALRVTPEWVQAIAQQAYIEMLRHGYTAVAEFHYLHNDADGKPYAEPAELLLRHLSAARASGIAVTLLPSLYAWSNFGGKRLQPRQKRFAADPGVVLGMVHAARHAAEGSPDVRVGVAPHSLRAADVAQFDELIAGLNGIDPQAPIHIHAAEQEREVQDCLTWCGRRPVEWLLARLPVDARWCVVHATHMTKAETRALVASGAVVGLCPTTEANLGDGIFPLLEYRAAGGRYGIGGDSHVSRNPAEELRLLEYVQRLATRRRNLVVREDSPATGTTLWHETAAGGAQALGRPMGAIARGLRADLVVLDPSHPNLVARSGDGIANALVFGGGEEGVVRDVMVGGQWRVREGHHPGAEAAEANYRRAMQELLA